MLGNIKYQVDEGFYVSWHHFLVIFCQKMTKWHKIMLCIQINRMSHVQDSLLQMWIFSEDASLDRRPLHCAGTPSSPRTASRPSATSSSAAWARTPTRPRSASSPSAPSTSSSRSSPILQRLRGMDQDHHRVFNSNTNVNYYFHVKFKRNYTLEQPSVLIICSAISLH